MKSDQFTVAPDAPCVQGHFPGMPVVPGAYLLGLLHKGFAQQYPDETLAHFSKVKFMAPIMPGELVTVLWDTSAWPKVQATLEVDGERRLQAVARACSH